MYGVFRSNGGSEKTVAALRNRLYISGILRVIPERLPQFPDRDSKPAVKIAKSISVPDAILDLLPSHNLSSIFQKNDQQTEGLLLNPYSPAISQEFPGSWVCFKRAKLIRIPNRRFHNITSKGERSRVYHCPFLFTASSYVPCSQRVAS